MVSSFGIGEWLVEPLQNRLVRGDARVKLDPKVMQVLVYLAERPNEIAEKESLIASVWDGTFVTDEVLTNAIFELRKALGDDAREPRFIQTVPRKGYRLVVPVETASAARGKPWRAGLAVVFGVAVVATLGWWYSGRRDDATPEPRVTPLTGYPGAEWWPALSPDGERVAFVWGGGKVWPMDLYVQLIGGGEPLRLTETPLHEYSPCGLRMGGRSPFFGNWAQARKRVGSSSFPRWEGRRGASQPSQPWITPASRRIPG